MKTDVLCRDERRLAERLSTALRNSDVNEYTDIVHNDVDLKVRIESAEHILMKELVSEEDYWELEVQLKKVLEGLSA